MKELGCALIALWATGCAWSWPWSNSGPWGDPEFGVEVVQLQLKQGLEELPDVNKPCKKTRKEISQSKRSRTKLLHLRLKRACTIMAKVHLIIEMI